MGPTHSTSRFSEAVMHVTSWARYSNKLTATEEEWLFQGLNFRRRFFNWVIPLQSPVATHPRTSLPRRREATVRLSNDLHAPDARDALVPMCQLSEILPCTETSCQRRARDSNGGSHAMKDSLCPVV